MNNKKRMPWVGILGVATIVILIIWYVSNTTNTREEAVERAKGYFAEMVIEYPKDLTLKDVKLEQTESLSGTYVRYRLQGVLYYRDEVTDIDVIMHHNLKDTVFDEWVMQMCNVCPPRIEPKPDTAEYDKWYEIYNMVFENN
jgi:hypothetical protein